MRAADSHPQFKAKVREYTNFATRGITRVCKEVGPRYCGSEAEAKGQQYMLNEFNTCADEAHIEEFEVHPGGLLGVTKVDAILVMCAILLSLFSLHWIALIPTVLAYIVLIVEFGFYKEFIDFLFPKRTSSNCIAVRKASGETRRRIIFAGHMDSSPEWHPTYYGGKVALFAVFIYAVAGLLYMTVLCILGIVLAVMNWVSLAFVPSYFLLFFFCGKPVVEGANDNLTGVFCSAAVMKYMADNDLRFEHTDLICMATGGEESGLRGAKAYMKNYAEQFKTDGIETVFVAADTIKDYDCQFVYAKDMSGITKHDIRACKLVQKAGELSDIKLDFSSIYLGASDAAAVTQAGIPAVAYAAMDPGPPKYYHTRLDTWQNLDRKTVEKGVEILINTAFLFDEQGLKENYD